MTDENKKIEVGKVYRTPYEPSGLVQVIAIEPPQSGYPECAFVKFVGDHPAGYKDGSHGRYFSSELRIADDVPANDDIPF